jgi:hypothetical protein
MVSWLKRYQLVFFVVAYCLAILDVTLSSLATCHPISETGRQAVESQNSQNCSYLHGPFLISLRWLIDFIDQHDGFFVVLFTAGLVAFTAALWRSTSQLWVAGEKQIDLTKRALISTERAFVSFVDLIWDAILDETGKISGYNISCVFENSGTTPTRHSYARMNWMRFPNPQYKEGLSHNFDFPELAQLPPSGVPAHDAFPKMSAFFIGPRTRISPVQLFIPTPMLVSVYQSAQCQLLIWGWIEYDDIFEDSKRHRTEFAFTTVLENDPANPGVGGLRVRRKLHYKYNGADEERTQQLRTLTKREADGSPKLRSGWAQIYPAPFGDGGWS